LPSIVDRGVVVRYYLDEGRGGGTPTLARDAPDTPLDLNLDYGAGNMSYAKGPRGWGLRWLSAGQHGVASALIGGSKFETMLEGSTEATIELVIEPDNVTTMFSRYFHVGVYERGGRFTATTNDIDQVKLALLDDAVANPAAVFDVDVVGQRAVWHLVFDSTQPNQMDRARLYINGVPQTSVANIVGADYALQIASADPFELCLGNRPTNPDDIRSFQGSLYYAAAYATALTPSEIKDNADVLLDDDDSPLGL
jgi:hypothetical protein